MKTKIICSAMVLAIMVPAILVPSLASATTAGGTAVPRVLCLLVTPAVGVVIDWTTNPILGGYYFNSEGAVIENDGNVMCDIELRGADAIMPALPKWTLRKTLNDPPQVNFYNLAWKKNAKAPPIWLHRVNYTKLYDNVPVGGKHAGFLRMRTPAVGSTIGKFSIATDFRAVPHSEKVSP